MPARPGPGGGPLLPTDVCPFCGAPDTGVPSLSALTADAVIAAAGLLATGLGDQSADVAPRRGKRWRYAAVVIDLPTMLGMAQNPGHVPGYGPVPAAIARELAANAPTWRRFLTDTTGVLLDAGAHTYRPTEALREHVTARDIREREAMRDLFGRQVGQAGLADLALDVGGPVVGERREVTVLFVDLRGYTRYSEGAPTRGRRAHAQPLLPDSRRRGQP
ncbi:MAG: DUF222 domain-containing protein [Microthrixaceae bacterium]